MPEEMAAIPRMMYGTAWKKDRTAALVTAAVRTGFRAVDTAAQRKHYRQDLVGQALADLAATHGVMRESIFLQTKFTSMGGQDASGFIPYDPRSPVSEQVTASFENSLKELQTSYIDSLLLHGPERTVAKTVEALLALKPYLTSKQLRYVGISNIYESGPLSMIQEELLKQGTHLSFIQNRFYAATGYDSEIREWCKQNGVIYQSFWTLTGNPHILKHKSVTGPAKRLQLTSEQVFYQFCIQEGIVPLNGTRNPEHMALGVQVLQGQAGELTDQEMEFIRSSLY